MRIRRLTSPLLPLSAALIVLAAPSPVAASCGPLDMSLPDPSDPQAVVFTGTVVGVDDVRTQMTVEAWFLGASPSDLIVVVGGRQPGTITSVDWMPAFGERYAVTGILTPDLSVQTEPCLQQSLDTTLFQALVARYGEPLIAPFPSMSPGPTGSPGPSPSPTEGTSPLPSVSPEPSSSPEI